MRCGRCERPALYFDRKGRAKSREDHDLCARCWRDAQNRDRAETLLRRAPFRKGRPIRTKEGPTPPPLPGHDH